MSSILVAGAGISGQNACRLLLAQGRSVILYDGDEKKNADELRAMFPSDADLRIVLGDLPALSAENVQECVISPGIPLDSELAKSLTAAGIPIISEIELACRYTKGSLIAITGTNGKTTTTALTGAICRTQFPETFVVGNIGNAYTKEADRTTERSVIVAECSSFQLETIDTFHPHISAILNITPDHLNRHGTMERYAEVKEFIARNQTKEDFCILNYEDERLRAYAPKCPARVLFFSSRRELDEGAFLQGDEICVRLDGKTIRVIRTDELQILGRHNHENAMAAILMTLAAGVSMENIRSALCHFQAVEHRIEYVTEKNGVVYYNDSKGTNPDAAIQAIRAMVRPTVLIGGGFDKGGEFDEWIQAFDGKVRELILLGQTAQRIADTARKLGFTNIVFADSLQDAVTEAARAAQPGDAVLLSPACASWGMFPNYEVRGRMFKELVRAL